MNCGTGLYLQCGFHARSHVAQCLCVRVALLKPISSQLQSSRIVNHGSGVRRYERNPRELSVFCSLPYAIVPLNALHRVRINFVPGRFPSEIRKSLILPDAGSSLFVCRRPARFPVIRLAFTQIHQQMTHPRIVKLTDVFEICCDSFATVLDYCRGTDLECLLRERKQLPERDARALVLQVARGLQYLNTAQVFTADIFRQKVRSECRLRNNGQHLLPHASMTWCSWTHCGI